MSLEEDKDEEKKSFIYRMMASLLIKAQSEMLEKELRKKGGMDRSIDRCQEIVRANTIASSILLHFDYSHIDAGVRKQWEKIAVEEVNEKLSTWEKDLASDNVYAERIPEDCNNSTAHLQDTITRLTAELEAANTTIASLTTDKQTLTTKSTRSAAGKPPDPNLKPSPGTLAFPGTHPRAFPASLRPHRPQGPHHNWEPHGTQGTLHLNPSHKP